MKKVIKLSLIASISCLFTNNYLFANNLIIETIAPVNFKEYPLPKAFTSRSHGGDLPDKVAATDGYDVTTDKNKIDNSAYNKFLYKNKDKLTNTINLNDLLRTGKIQISNNNLNKINTVMGKKLVPIIKCNKNKGITLNKLKNLINNYCNNNSNCSNHQANNSPVALSIINACTSNITDMSFLFLQKNYFNLPLNKWDTSNVTNMEGIFVNDIS